MTFVPCSYCPDPMDCASWQSCEKGKAPMTEPWTVVLLYPERLRDNESDTFTAYVDAETASEAIKEAQKQAMKLQAPKDRKSATEFIPLGTFKGTHHNYVLDQIRVM